MTLVPRQVISEATAEQLFEPNKVCPQPPLRRSLPGLHPRLLHGRASHRHLPLASTTPQPHLTTSGIFTMQLYRYWVRHFHSQPKDHWAVQCVVVATAIMAYLTTGTSHNVTGISSL